MTSFRQRPSRRRERSLTARALVTGFPVSDIQHGNRRAILLPARNGKPPHGDHDKRYAVGQRLAVKEYIPGPTSFHVRVTDVQGKSDGFYVGHVTRAIAKELGHVRLDAFWRHWLLNHDQAWYVRNSPADDHVTDEEIARRFASRWAERKLAWLIRFDIDHETSPRLLSATSGGADSFREGPDRRWVYAPRDTDREEDRGYTSSDSHSVNGELPALTDDEWATHIGPKSPYRIAGRLADKKAETWQVRYAAARSSAREAGKDIRSESRRFDLLMAQGKTEKAMRQLDLIEARLFPVAA